ncbi:MAG: trypsin-like peptidase domain-containing protein [Saprospiraceae bacterium]|nr:trypsin-like peptidase domain-containing protein [Saprospiraceae bacterium]
MTRFLFLLIGILPTIAFAQPVQKIPTAAERPEWAALINEQAVPVVAIPRLDAAAALADDSRTPGQNRFAAPVFTTIDIQQSGVWTALPDGGRVWRCQVKSPGALALLPVFDVLRLPQGAQFFAYTPDRSSVWGAYTAESCLPDGRFLIGPIRGESFVLELIEPAPVRGQSQLQLTRVDYAYDKTALNGAEGPLDFGQSLACNVNINCSTGADWQSHKRGVARILMVFPGGSGWCSGTLVANTAGTYDPYFLTAHHCQLLLNNPDFPVWRFDFDYEAVGCTNPATEPQTKSVLGCERIAYRAQTDFMLLKINPIPTNYDVYFNGWTRDTATTKSRTVYIHHPQGDIKKISIDTQAASIHPQTLNWGGVYGVSPVRTHWKTVLDIGTFQPGSSGSPLFDQNKRVIGQLHGGSTTNGGCTVTGAYSGRFDLSWAQGGTAGSQLKNWLDAGNLNMVSVNGYARPVIPGYVVSGNIQTHWGQPMLNVKVFINAGNGITAYTDAQGNFAFNDIPAGGAYTVVPTLDTIDLNGVSTFDLVLTSKHILSIEPLDSPWKIIAADVNQSGSVTTFDIVESRKVLLGINAAFPNNTSWRFLPAATTFSNPGNPFASGLPQSTIFIPNLQGPHTNANFKGIKVGDVNNSATGSN